MKYFIRVKENYWIVNWLYLEYTYVATSLLFAALSLLFLLEESYSYDNAIDCFVTNTTNNKVLDQNQLLIVHYYENADENTIKCFTFVYRFGPGIAALGGVITMSKIIMNIIAAVFLN